MNPNKDLKPTCERNWVRKCRASCCRKPKLEEKPPGKQMKFENISVWCRHGCCDITDIRRRCDCRC